VQALRIGDAVSMLGEVEGEAKRLLFELSDVLVLPSHTECFGMVVTEALAHGVPVIASHGTPWNELEAEGCGLWVGNDPVSLAAAVRRLAQMPLEKMGDSGRRWMRDSYSWQRCASAMLDCYARLLAAPEAVREAADDARAALAGAGPNRIPASGGLR
jgi:glycosyltransferase involved in cell wall biosynthesis